MNEIFRGYTVGPEQELPARRYRQVENRVESRDKTTALKIVLRLQSFQVRTILNNILGEKKTGELFDQAWETIQSLNRTEFSDSRDRPEQLEKELTTLMDKENFERFLAKALHSQYPRFRD